jgi:hypothetical protein
MVWYGTCLCFYVCETQNISDLAPVFSLLPDGLLWILLELLHPADPLLGTFQHGLV